MKHLKISLAILLLFTFLNGCGKSDNKTSGDNSETKNSKDNTEQTQTSSDQSETVIVQLPTMQCAMCKKNIESAVKKIDGINEVNVVVKEKIAKVNFDKSVTDLSKIEGVIVAAGYQANDKPADKDSYEKLDDCCKLGGHDK
ncbi:MAG: cation transporter [Ignavibacteria bacterium]|nr:cation transporter [Ignavibacteria bacterium]